MTTLAKPTETTTIVDAMRALAPTIRARAAEIEAARRVPLDLVDAITDAGAFRLLVPATFGGAEAHVATVVHMLEELAATDASTAWSVMIGIGSAVELTALPAATLDAVYADGPDLIVAGVINPTGTIERVAGGYRVNGRWAFASGCEHARWIWGNCIAGIVDGEPQMRIAVFDPADVVIEDTWHVAGLCGTGSHHFHVQDVVVPAERTLNPFAEEPGVDAPVAYIPPPSFLPTAAGAVAVGIAQGALDDIVAIASERTPLLAPSTLATNPQFHCSLARADTALHAARALLAESADVMWDRAVAREELTLAERARVRANAVWCTEQAVAVVEFAFRAGGSHALYLDSTLQRRLRDIEVLAQHFLLRPDTMIAAGDILAGNEPELMVF